MSDEPKALSFDDLQKAFTAKRHTELVTLESFDFGGPIRIVMLSASRAQAILAGSAAIPYRRHTAEELPIQGDESDFAKLVPPYREARHGDQHADVGEQKYLTWFFDGKDWQRGSRFLPIPENKTPAEFVSEFRRVVPADLVAYGDWLKLIVRSAVVDDSFNLLFESEQGQQLLDQLDGDTLIELQRHIFRVNGMGEQRATDEEGNPAGNLPDPS